MLTVRCPAARRASERPAVGIGDELGGVRHKPWLQCEQKSLSPETLRKIESGRVATPAFSTIAAIADVLGLSLDAAWAEINQPERGAEPVSDGHTAP